MACVSINGANRLGSNSLTEMLVFGARAGKAAAAFAAEQPAPRSRPGRQAHDEQRRLAERFLRKNGGKERIATLRAEMHQIMEAERGHLPDGDDPQGRRQGGCSACRSDSRTSPWTTAATPSTPS